MLVFCKPVAHQAEDFLRFFAIDWMIGFLENMPLAGDTIPIEGFFERERLRWADRVVDAAVEDDEGCFDFLGSGVGRCWKAVARGDAAAGYCRDNKPIWLFRGEANRDKPAHAMAVGTEFC